MDRYFCTGPALNKLLFRCRAARLALDKARNLARAITHRAANTDERGAFAGDTPLGERIRLHLKDRRGLNGGEEGFNLQRHNFFPVG
jgi:hypothetical protein